MKKSLLTRRTIFSLFCIGAALSLGLASMNESEGYWVRQLRKHGKMNLPVKSILQSKATSCGEAAFVMSYNYAYPENQIAEQDAIDYASKEGYYTERKFPFTTPENMVKIAKHYADAVSTGSVKTADEGLALLTEKLTGGDPVVIDVLSRLYDSKSGAHFVVVTGLVIDGKNPNKTKILFNDPLTNSNRWGYWLGGEGVWNAWQNNGDVGGAGWWMVVSSP